MMAANYVGSANTAKPITDTSRTSQIFPSCAVGLVGTVPATDPPPDMSSVQRDPRLEAPGWQGERVLLPLPLSSAQDLSSDF